MGPKKSRPRKSSTRHAAADQIVGGPADLPAADLPLLAEVLAKAKQIRNTFPAGPGLNVTKELINLLYVDIVNVYMKTNSNLVLITERQAKTNLNSAYTEYKELLRSGVASSSPKMIRFQEKCGKSLM